MTKSERYTQTPSRVLGIDPGYGRLGIAVIERGILLHSECFETSKNMEHAERLAAILQKLRKIIKKYKPNRLAIETLVFSKNTKTALKVAEVRGVITAEAASCGIPIEECHPNTVKIAVTGYGRSDKRQIIYMIEKIFRLKKKFKHDDEYDAIAIALTALGRKSFPHPRAGRV